MEIHDPVRRISKDAIIMWMLSDITSHIGLVEFQLITVTNEGDNGRMGNILYPFFPVKCAHEIMNELLPGYKVKPEMNKLPQKALWIKRVSLSWFWIFSNDSIVDGLSPRDFNGNFVVKLKSDSIFGEMAVLC